MSNNEEFMKNIVRPLSASSASLSRANCHLNFALAKHLIEKGIIDLGEYLESQLATEEVLKKEVMLTSVGENEESSEMHVEHIEMMFALHRSQLTQL